MRRFLVALLVVLGIPFAAHARSLAREGIVALLPGVRFSSSPDRTEGMAPNLTLAFGFKPSSSLEVGIDLGGSYASGGPVQIVAAPLMLRMSWTPLPDLDVRPVLHGGFGKQLMTVKGAGKYREHTPYAGLVGAGLQADLSAALGLQLDAGYLHARAEDEALGRIDGGGPFVRAGLYFRFEPTPERRL